MSTSVGPKRIDKTGLVLDLDATKNNSVSSLGRNLWSFPEELSNAVWNKNNSFITDNVVAAPDGTLTGDKLTATNQYASLGRTSVVITTQVGETYTTSGFAKYLDQQYLNIVIENPNAGSVTFDLIGGVISGSFNATGTITPAGNGWYRCTMTYTMGVGSVLIPKFWIGNYDGTNRAGQSVYLWGLQLELGTANDYYPVSSSVITNLWSDLSSPISKINYRLDTVEVLVVGGGGGGGGKSLGTSGGTASGGGGGAGGVIYNTAFSVIAGNTYPITVGSGGAGGGPFINGGNGVVNGTSGSNSTFGSLTAFGGGYGGGNGVNIGGSGGSGGGTSGDISVGMGTTGQGNNGGSGQFAFPYARGGGGGAGGLGSSGDFITGSGGAGGPGRLISISGFPLYYGGGGGGGAYTGTGGDGGLGGGGAGGSPSQENISANSGIPGTGGGGGGQGSGNVNNLGRAGNGGSGIVIVRYPEPQRAIGGTITLKDGYVIHTFTEGTGSFIVNSPSIVEGINITTSTNASLLSVNNGALSFNGSNTYLLTNDANILTNLASLTINIWLNGKDLATRINDILGKGTGDTDEEYCILAGNGTLYFDVGNNAGPYTQPSYTFSNNTWYNISCVHNRTAGNSSLIIYVNGAQLSSSTVTPTNPPNDNVFPISIGRRFYNSDPFNRTFNGFIPVVQIYTRALTAAEVLQNFNALRGRYGI
jgi:hypothetical protein